MDLPSLHNPVRTHLHFVGIGGIGMSGIAEVFRNQGYIVSGSDLIESEATRRLAGLGVRISIGHREENVHSSQVVIISSAVKPSNPEVIEARKLRIPVIPRAEMLGELMRGKIGIAVAGTHGKTTTTSMIATVLIQAKLDPTIVIGGRVDSLGGNAKLGQGKIVIAEADESDGSFLHLPATYAVVTNIDNDHLDFFGSMEAVDDAFMGFIGKLPFYGVAAICGDDPGVRRVIERMSKPFATYGLSEESDFFAADLALGPRGSTYRLMLREIGASGSLLIDAGRIELNVPGKHNVFNSLAAAAILLKMGLSFENVAAGLAAFKGVKRRFDIRHHDEKTRIAIIDDYGHHPTEIAATLAAARRFWSGRIVAVFQPHRFTRTLHCHRGFLGAFKDADLLYMTDIYAAGEDPIPGVTAEKLCEDVSSASGNSPKAEYVGTLDQARVKILRGLKAGDLVICMGAGTITRLPDQLIAELPR